METGGFLEPIPVLKNVSYLYARDPSVLSWGGAGKCRKNLATELRETTTASLFEPDVRNKNTCT